MHNTNGKESRLSTQPSPQIVIAKPTPSASERPSSLPVFALLHALRRRWKVALPLGLCLGALGAFFAAKFFESEYTASGYLRIDADNTPLIFRTADQMPAGGSNYLLYKNTQMQLMRTPFVLNAALRDPQVADLTQIKAEPDPVAWLQEKLKIEFPGNGEIMQVSYSSESPTECVTLVNAVINAYMKEVVVDERNERLQRRDSLERVYADAETKVRNKRAELRTLANALGTGDSESLTVAQQNALQQFGLMQEQLGNIQFQLMQAEGELRVAQDIAAENQDKIAEAPDQSLPEFELLLAERPDDVVRLEDEVASIRGRLSAQKLLMGSAHPSVQQIQQELITAEESLERHRQEARERADVLRAAEGSARPTTEQTGFDIVGLNSRIQVLKNQEKMLQEKVDALEAETKHLGRSSIDVELMRAEIASLEDVLHRVGAEAERSAIELKTGSRIKLISAAERAKPPDVKKRITRIASLGLMGFVAPFALLVVWDLSRRNVDNVEALTDSLALDSLGTIPISPAPLPRLADERKRDPREQAQLAEAVDSLASMISHRAEVDDRKVLMITSAVPGEGKSTVACQLASSLALFGKKVALVDFDLRRPSIHRYLQLDTQPGVSDVLCGRCTWAQAIQHPDQANLHVLTAGEQKTNLHQHCTNGSANELFQSLRDAFDVVIVDTCPVLGVSDTSLIGKFCDGVILTLVRDVSRLPLAAQTCELLKAYGIDLMGTVVIGGRGPSYPADYYAADIQAQKPPKKTWKLLGRKKSAEAEIGSE